MSGGRKANTWVTGSKEWFATINFWFTAMIRNEIGAHGLFGASHSVKIPLAGTREAEMSSIAALRRVVYAPRSSRLRAVNTSKARQGATMRDPHMRTVVGEIPLGHSFPGAIRHEVDSGLQTLGLWARPPPRRIGNPRLRNNE